MLPITAEVFLTSLEHYNRAWWPAHVGALFLGTAALGVAVRPVFGGARTAWAVMAVAWLWSGLAHQWAHFGTLLFFAPATAALLVVQGLLLAWEGVVRGRLAMRWRQRPAMIAGAGLVAYGLIAVPLIDILATGSPAAAAVFALAPDATALVTLGLLLLVDGKVPARLVVLPVLWCLFSAVMAWMLWIPWRLPVALLALAAVVMILGKRRR